MQFSISFVNSTEICTLFSVQTVAALCDYRAVPMYLNSGCHSACLPVILSYLPRTPDIGNISDCRLASRHHRTLTSAWFSCRRPHYVQLWLDGSIIIPLCRSSRTDCRIGFGSCSLSLGYKSTYGIILSQSSFGEVPCLSDL